VSAGFSYDLLSPRETLTDSPIKSEVPQSNGSYMLLGAVNDVTALKRYSNVYMFYTALRLGGDFRYPFPNNSKANVDADGGIQKLRNYYNQLGLGVKTGIDFPYEEVGLEGPSTSTGLL